MKLKEDYNMFFKSLLQNASNFLVQIATFLLQNASNSNSTNTFKQKVLI